MNGKAFFNNAMVARISFTPSSKLMLSILNAYGCY